MGSCREVAQVIGCDNSDSDSVNSNSSTIEAAKVVSVLTTTVNSNNSRGDQGVKFGLERCVCARVCSVLFVYKLFFKLRN